MSESCNESCNEDVYYSDLGFLKEEDKNKIPEDLVYSLLEKYGFDKESSQFNDNDTKLLSVMTYNDYPPCEFFQEIADKFQVRFQLDVNSPRIHNGRTFNYATFKPEDWNEEEDLYEKWRPY